MERAGDIDMRGCHFWTGQNPDVLAIPFARLLEQEWGTAIKTVEQNRKMVLPLNVQVLRTSSRDRDPVTMYEEIGGLIPADMLYALHLTGDRKQRHPVAHVEINAFRDHPEDWLEASEGRLNTTHLKLRKNLVLLDNGKPVCALVTPFFLLHLEVTDDHDVHFKPNVFRVIFPAEKNRLPEPKPASVHKIPDIQLTEEAREAWRRKHIDPMSQLDSEILDSVLGILRSVKRSPEDIQQAVENIRISSKAPLSVLLQNLTAPSDGAASAAPHPE